MPKINFLDDLKGIVSNDLAALGFAVAPTDTIDALLSKYLNVNRRLPPVIKWNIKQSKELRNLVLAAHLQRGLADFIAKAQNGENLKPYLSTRISDPDYSDLMFYDWAIFHFHLGTQLGKRGFIERTDELLFAIAHPQGSTLFLLDVHPHKNAFSRQELLGIIEKNWSHILEPYALNDVVGLSHKYTDAELHELRKAGVNVLTLTPSGSVIMGPGGGITTAATSAQIAGDIIRIKYFMVELEKMIETKRADIEESTGKSWDELDIKLTEYGDIAIVKELTTGKFLFSGR